MRLDFGRAFDYVSRGERSSVAKVWIIIIRLIDQVRTPRGVFVCLDKNF